MSFKTKRVTKSKKRLLRMTSIVEANGLRLKVWFWWDQINCTVTFIKAREVIGPNGFVGDLITDSESDTDSEDGDGDFNANNLGQDGVGGQGNDGAGGGVIIN